MEKDSDVDLPPPYSQLVPSSEVPENGSVPVVSNSFESKNARVVFIQKVLSIFLMQTVAVDLVLETFLYIRIFHRHFDIMMFLAGSVVLYLSSIALLLKCYLTRHRTPFNYVILVYQPIAVTVMLGFLLRALLGLNMMGDDMLEMISLAWKAYIFSGPVILLYSVFCLDSQQEFKLRNCIFVATGIFVITSLCVIPYVKKVWNGPSTVFSTIAVFYSIYLYVLYDIVAMTKPDYHETITPADYVNGAVNLSIDFVIIIRNFIRRTCSCFCINNGPIAEVVV